MAFLDVIGVASILPFMTVMANPQYIESNQLINAIYLKMNFESQESFLFFLGVFFFFFLVLSLAFKALTTYVQLRFTLMREYTLGRRLLEGYICRPYSWFLDKHSSDLGKTILSEVSSVIDYGIVPFVTLVAQGFVVVAILMLLVFIDPALALVVGLTLSFAYAIVFKLTRGFLTRIGKERFAANQDRFAAVSEAFAAVKEIKLGGFEQSYINRFALPAQAYARNHAAAQVVTHLPRFALEAIAFGGMVLVVLYLMSQKGDFVSNLPIIALYAFAGYRLMPALQQIYGALTHLRFVGPGLDALHNDLMSIQPADVKQTDDELVFVKSIVLSDVIYNYPNTSRPALKNISMKIPARSTVGIVGSTGSGKTTLIDLILGLLEAQEGQLEIDGKRINRSNLGSWQRMIGYVPQQIYLSDDTIASNIAFGLDPNDIDLAAVERAAKIANLHEFVINELPQKYLTTVGERGVRLSGGQRQRIGIARALYHSPEVLILDEATSALDNLTEQAVMDAVNNLSQNITIILIAHRLSTVRNCEIIFLLENGEIKAQGSFDDLVKSDDKFRAMAASH